jgi:uncharacterized protein
VRHPRGRLRTTTKAYGTARGDTRGMAQTLSRPRRISLTRSAGVVTLAVAGLTAAAYGCGRHLPRLVLGDGGLVDVAGTAIGLAGVALVVAAFWLGFAGRSRRAKLLAVPIALLLAQFYVLPVVTAALAVNADRFDVAPAASLGFAGAHDVSFRTRDGVELHGWLVPGPRRAAVVLAHGSHGSRQAVEAHLRMLAGLGYPVLAYDARGHGESAGDPNALGWRGADDIDAAVGFLRTRPGLDAGRVAVLGVSMGAEEALRAATRNQAIAAIVADGAGASTAGDEEAAGASGLERAVTWLSMRATEALSGDSEPAPLTSRVGAIEAPVLLIASDAPRELAINREFAREIDQARVWHVRAGHTEGLSQDPTAYRERVRRFLEGQL